MIEIRIHGRGGQGGVTSATILAKAAGYEGKYSQAFSAFGPERKGAPVKAFCRIDSSPIYTRTQVHEPDYIMVLDPTLVRLPEVSQGAKPGTAFIINSAPERLPFSQKAHFFNASGIALEILKADIVNTAMLGAFAKITGLVSMESILKAADEVFEGRVAELNRQVIRESFEKAKK